MDKGQKLPRLDAPLAFTPSDAEITLTYYQDPFTRVVPGTWAPDEPLEYPVRFGDGRVITAEDL